MKLITDLCGDEDKISQRLQALLDLAQQSPGIEMYLVIAPHQEGLLPSQLPSNLYPRFSTSPYFASAALLRKFSEHNGCVTAWVSAGDTRRIVVALNREVGFYSKPALACLQPSLVDPIVFCDVGASIATSPEDFLINAQAGIAVHRALLSGPVRIGLLNIGEEPTKGPEILQEAHRLLRERFPEEFVGNIEPHRLLLGEANVVVCDGFSGNLVLKAQEGVEELFRKHLRAVARPNPLLGVIGFTFSTLFRFLFRQFDWRNYSGAFLFGTKAPVFIAHGRSDYWAFRRALERAIDPQALCAFEFFAREEVEK